MEVLAIKKLTRVIESVDGELETSRPPNNVEIMNKMNEIIDWINKYDSFIKEQKVNTEFKNMFKIK